MHQSKLVTSKSQWYSLTIPQNKTCLWLSHTSNIADVTSSAFRRRRRRDCGSGDQTSAQLWRQPRGYDGVDAVATPHAVRWLHRLIAAVVGAQWRVVCICECKQSATWKLACTSAYVTEYYQRPCTTRWETPANMCNQATAANLVAKPVSC